MTTKSISATGTGCEGGGCLWKGSSLPEIYETRDAATSLIVKQRTLHSVRQVASASSWRTTKAFHEQPVGSPFPQVGHTKLASQNRKISLRSKRIEITHATETKHKVYA